MKARLISSLLTLSVAAVAGVLCLQVLRTGGLPNPLAHGDFGARLLDIAVLVFREGLECILVLAAVTANMAGERRSCQRPVVAGSLGALIATVATWFVAIGVLTSLADSIPALKLQAATGLLAIIVLLVVMNWFFHKVYWTGWISMHSRRQAAADQAMRPRRGSGSGWPCSASPRSIARGSKSSCFCRPTGCGSARPPCFMASASASRLTAIVGILTFVAHRRLPYRRMLVLTGLMLGLVLLVMVGEQAQEMQLANWLPTTPIPSLSRYIPDWMGLWFAVFPTAETLAAQALAAAVVVGSYYLAREHASAPVAG